MAAMDMLSSPAPSPEMRAVDSKISLGDSDAESGYGSASSSSAASTLVLPQVSFTPAHLRHINEQLETMQPKEILRFVKVLFPNLFQTTAFGLSGLVTLDMLDKIQKESPASAPVEVIFLDTLYHFKETYELIDRIKARYPAINLHIFKPDGFETAEQFEGTYDKLYEMSEEMYDWVAKVEPQQRAYDSLRVAAVITGRRRSQGGKRDKIPIIEVDSETNIVKINPMVNWSFKDVQAYIKENDVPYNVLLDRGYKSVGDWHSTSPVGEGEDERAGRWKGRNKTECGIHNNKSRYAQFSDGTQPTSPAEPAEPADETLSENPSEEKISEAGYVSSEINASVILPA